jgi:DNA-binding CsgD family transcriptional regulator
MKKYRRGYKMQKQELTRATIELVDLGIINSSEGYRIIDAITKDTKYCKKESTQIIEKNKNIKRRSKWQENEMQFIKDNYNIMTLKELAEKLGRTPYSVQGRIYNVLKLKKENSIRIPWSEREQMFIEQFSDKYSAIEIAQKLNRSESLIYKKLTELKNKKAETIALEVNQNGNNTHS